MSSKSTSKLTARERIAKARINLLTDYPFHGNIAMEFVSREVSEQESKAFGINTMAVDLYGNLLYYPPCVQQQTDAIMKAGIAHEVMHVALRHLSRLGTRDPKTWNIAVDAAVNEVLSHTFHLPDGWVHIPQMKQKCAEEIYDWIIKNAKTYKVLASRGFDSLEKKDPDQIILSDHAFFANSPRLLNLLTPGLLQCYEFWQPRAFISIVRQFRYWLNKRGMLLSDLDFSFD